MKNLFVLLCLLIGSNHSFGNHKKVVQSTVKNVTVFLNGAQVFRHSKMNIKKGITDLVFDSLSTTMNTNSIQVKGKGNFIILDTKYRLIQPKGSTISPKIPAIISQQVQLLQDSIDLLSFDLEELQFRKEVLALEKKILIGNKSIQSDSLQLLKDALFFFREKYNNINTSLIQLKKKEYLLNKLKIALDDRFAKMKANHARVYVVQPSKPNHQIIVTISAAEATTGTMELNYLVSGASWSPKYDIRATGINEPIALTYSANIYQNSGEDWENVHLKLATNNPNKSKTKPVLPVWYLNYYRATNPPKRSKYSNGIQKSKASTSKMEAFSNYDKLEEKLAPAQTSAYYATINDNLTSIAFDISIPYSIPSDGQNHLVSVKSEKLKAQYQYYMVPKLDKDAFLVANISGFEELSLLPAKANVYFEGTFIGETMLNPDVMGDSLALTLGRDERISIRRKLTKEVKKDKLLNDDRTELFTYQLLLKNNRVNDIDIIIEDHIPVPQFETIKVDLLSSDDASYKKETGMLSWSFPLFGQQIKTIEYTYTVKHKKDKPLI
jgi:uncharacterized protein (TIGR02231 family)